MSDQTRRDPEVIFTMDVDRYSEFIDQAESVASAGSRSLVRPPVNAPILTVEVDEMMEITQKAIPGGNPPCGGDQKRESA